MFQSDRIMMLKYQKSKTTSKYMRFQLNNNENYLNFCKIYHFWNGGLNISCKICYIGTIQSFKIVQSLKPKTQQCLSNCQCNKIDVASM